ISVEDYRSKAGKVFTYEVSTHKVEQVLKHAHVEAQSDKPICELTDEAYARILFSLARTSKAIIIIFNKILQNLTDEYFEKAIELSDEYINNNLTIVMIDDNVERVSKASNYIAWVSHGQLRMEGSIKQ